MKRQTSPVCDLPVKNKGFAHETLENNEHGGWHPGRQNMVYQKQDLRNPEEMGGLM